MKIKELMMFLKQSFIDNKKIFLIVLLKSVFLSFSSLFLVVGLGTIVEQLLDGNNLISLLQPIFLYSFIPLIINLIATSLTFYIDYLTRISTNKIQYDYVDDALTVNYHYYNSFFKLLAQFFYFHSCHLGISLLSLLFK